MLSINKVLFKNKTFYILLFSATFFSLLLPACSPSSSQKRMQGSNYFIAEADDSHIYISKKSNEAYEIVIDQQIVDYRESPGYLFVLRKEAKSYQCGSGEKRTIITSYSDKNSYWIIDLRKELEFNTIDHGVFLDKVKSLGLTAPAFDFSKKYYVNDQLLAPKLKSCIAIN